MNIRDYRIEKTALRDAYPIERLARSLKRDMLILFPLTFILIIIGDMTNNRPITMASYISFASIFASFIGRMLYFRFKNNLSGCPVCRHQLSRMTLNQTQYVVCQYCHSIFAAYQKSNKPDRLYQEVDIQSALGVDKEMPTTGRTIPPEARASDVQ